MARPWPTRLAFRSSDRALHATFDDGVTVRVPYELLRVESPSAEVQGHAPDQKKLVTGKEQVEVTQAEPVGRYAVRLTSGESIRVLANLVRRPIFSGLPSAPNPP